MHIARDSPSLGPSPTNRPNASAAAAVDTKADTLSPRLAAGGGGGAAPGLERQRSAGGGTAKPQMMRLASSLVRANMLGGAAGAALNAAGLGDMTEAAAAGKCFVCVT